MLKRPCCPEGSARRWPARPDAGGFSLAEVVVALGILASVLISMAGLFVLGNRQVHSGRNSSTALALARDVLEEIKGWGFGQTYTLFGASCDPATDSCLIGTEDPAVDLEQVRDWQERLDSVLPRSRGQILVEAIDAAALQQSRALRVTVTVFWSEGERLRTVRLVTVRM